ncbi:conserved hypothetical protein [Talaromyces stipitatus ATCC 10500]|uniref:Tf2-1-like SH3-like domain-containing protein n=1 Tax=Talaromyces stipitatus (strain ATCC 10500 / CBS 375.48 / QM 6759 / NRRL 1006) TaxID=441959 RepID=B8M0X1_TALSN|nr:uncharacterized protein TSTA_089900 [Talaromyces stipitatus ATCC 10500]EED21751.1 conserved hypothetical protein [Talaromyces stipitatus ATCC 10500]
MSRDIMWAEQRMKRYYDRSKTFNIKSKRPSNKLDIVKFRLFTIKEKLANNNYKLQLPARMHIHPIFHISLLEPTKNPENSDEEADEEEYEVEKLLERKLEKRQIYYLIRVWNYKGSPEGLA